MQVREARSEERERWDEFVLGSAQGSFLQTWEWGAAQEIMGSKMWRLVVEDAGEWQAVLLLVRRELPLGQGWLYGSWGPVMARAAWGRSDVFLALQKKIEELAGEERAVWVRVDAPVIRDSEVAAGWQKVLEESGWEKSEREVQPAATLVLDLGKSEEELLAGMKSKTRYNVRLAERNGVTVRWSKDVKDVEVFWQLAQEVSERSGFSYHSKNYYEAILEKMNSGGGQMGAELAIAEHAGDVLAVHLMVYAGGRATYLHGASSDKQRQLMAPALLYWETIKRAKERGCSMYDFWGVAPEGADRSHPWAGVTRMKEGFGGRREFYAGTYDLVAQPWVYHMIEVARRVKKVLR